MYVKNLSKQLPSPLYLREQVSAHSLTRHQDQDWFRLKPEIVAYRNNEVVSVIDTKWKLLDSALNSSRDKYNLNQTYLSRILVNLTKKEKSAIEFELHTNDVNLSQAFSNQCELFSAKAMLVKTRNASKVLSISSIETVSYETEFLSALSSPKTVVELKEILNISQSSFTRVMNHLIKNNKIERESENQKQWVKA